MKIDKVTRDNLSHVTDDYDWIEQVSDPRIPVKNGVLQANENCESITSAECVLRASLIEHLKYNDLSLDLEWQPEVRISKTTVARFLDTIGKPVPEEYLDPVEGFKTIRRVPELLCRKYAFVVECDGKVHDKLDKKIRKDNIRDFEYAAAGINVFRIDREQVFNLKERQRFIKDVIEYIKLVDQDKIALKKTGNRVRKSLSRGAQLDGQKARKPTTHSADGSYRKNGGLVYVLRRTLAK